MAAVFQKARPSEKEADCVLIFSEVDDLTPFYPLTHTQHTHTPSLTSAENTE